jgi:pimeloyl-ACP methyl ester carboxylesterase|tara:strand:- start:130 stop:1098 length:969 start_codon:yes stop_codon:yes gene_type:complete
LRARNFDIISSFRSPLASSEGNATPGLSLLEAARRSGLDIAEAAEPTDKTVELNGLKFHYLDWGNGHLPDLLFLHGTAQQGHSWDFASLALRERFHCMALDQRGHGDSEWDPDGKYGAPIYVPDVEAFVDALGLQNFVLVGHSMGGRNAYTYTSAHGDKVRALIVVDAGPRMEEPGGARVRNFMDGQREFDTYDDLVERVHSYLPGRPIEQLRGSLTHTTRQFPNGKWSWKYDPNIRRPVNGPGDSEEARWDTLSKIACPTLYVIGGDSEMLTPPSIERMLEVIPGSVAETVERAGHLVAGDNPAGFHAAVSPFLASLPPST